MDRLNAKDLEHAAKMEEMLEALTQLESLEEKIKELTKVRKDLQTQIQVAQTEYEEKEKILQMQLTRAESELARVKKQLKDALAESDESGDEVVSQAAPAWSATCSNDCKNAFK